MARKNDSRAVIRISRVKKVAKSDLAAVNGLLTQLSSSPRTLDMKTYRRMLSGKNYFLFAARDGRRMIGMASLVLSEIPTAFRTRMEDVVVDEKYRGQGIGEKLCRVIISVAEKHGGDSMDLTSNPKRVQAHKLYEKLGFNRRDTEVYRRKLRKSGRASASPKLK